MRIDSFPLKGLTITALFLVLSVSFLFSQDRRDLLQTNCPVAQHEVDKWFFGVYAGIDFTGETTVPLTNNWQMQAYQGCAIYSDPNGGILFYTDGMRVWDKTGQVMPSGSGLLGNQFAAQPTIIVPHPASDSDYYVFTVDVVKDNGPVAGPTYGFKYSVVDMTLRGGLGDVTAKNKDLLPEVCDKLTAVRHANGTDVWVLVHKYNSNEFAAFSVTESGLDTVNYVSTSIGPVIQNSPFVPPPNLQMDHAHKGMMKISPDGSKVALAINTMNYNQGFFEIYNFNNSTGRLSDWITSAPTYNGAYGVEFSADGKRLYGTTAFIDGNPDTTSSIYQFNVEDGANIFNNGVLLATNVGTYFTGLQLGTDGKIYIGRGNDATSGMFYLSVIQNPKRLGAECNLDEIDYNAITFDLASKKSSWGLPNFDQDMVFLPHFDIDSTCYLDGTTHQLQVEDNIESVSWDFGDPNSSQNTSTQMRPIHYYSEPGDYTVTVTETFNGQQFTYTETVVINELPPPFPQEMPDTVYMFSGSSVRLNANQGYQSYLWSTGETSDFITVNESGAYWLIVQNEKCCFAVDTVYVLLFDVVVPNAFHPGGTSNTEFKAIPTSDVDISNYSMYIYNRWGQIVFEGNDISQGWDGMYEGDEAPGDVYVWIINYYVERDGSEERVTTKGNVVLLR